MKKYLIISAILLSGFIGFALSQVQKRAYMRTFFTPVIFRDAGGAEVPSPELYVAEIETETAICYVLTHQNGLIGFQSNMNDLSSLGCVKK